LFISCGAITAARIPCFLYRSRATGLFKSMAMKYFDIPPGVKVYTLNICEALKDHGLCPGLTTLKACEHALAAEVYADHHLYRDDAAVENSLNRY
jgi:hypothetical protein